MSIVSRRIFYINSRRRISGSNSDFTYRIDLQGLDVSHAVCLQAHVPKSFYTVPAGKNTFTLTEDGKDATITMTPGSYSINTIKSNLQTILNASSPNGWSYTITSPASTAPQTGKLTFSVSGNSSQPSFHFDSYMWEQLGFEADSSYVFVSDFLVSTSVINLQPESTVFIHSDIIQSYDNVLQEVYSTNSLSYSAIDFHQQNVHNYAKPLMNKSGNVYRFYLTDENDSEIDLNGLNFVITLLVFKAKKRNDQPPAPARQESKRP